MKIENLLMMSLLSKSLKFPPLQIVKIRKVIGENKEEILYLILTCKNQGQAIKVSRKQAMVVGKKILENTKCSLNLK